MYKQLVLSEHMFQELRLYMTVTDPYLTSLSNAECDDSLAFALLDMVEAGMYMAVCGALVTLRSDTCRLSAIKEFIDSCERGTVIADSSHHSILAALTDSLIQIFEKGSKVEGSESGKTDSPWFDICRKLILLRFSEKQGVM